MHYRIKITLPESKIFYREFAVDSNMGLYAFHQFLSNHFGFDPDQMVYFEGRDAADKRKSRYCLFDMGDGAMDQITFADIASAEEIVSMRYIFEMHTRRHFVITIEGEEAFNPRIAYPALLDGKGDNPSQFNKYVDPEPYVPIVPTHRGFDDDDEDFDDEDDEDDEEDDGDEDGELLVDEDFGKEE